jgi:hypothetical protein
MLVKIISTPEIIFMGLFSMGSLSGPFAPVFSDTVFRIAFLPVKVFAGFAMIFFRFSVFKQIILIWPTHM